MHNTAFATFGSDNSHEEMQPREMLVKPAPNFCRRVLKRINRCKYRLS